MPKFLTIGYGDEQGYGETPLVLRAAAHAFDADQVEKGALIARAGPPTQVRNTEAKGIEATGGPFLSAALPIAGFSIIEAADLAEAIGIASQAPCAICHGVVEVWPLEIEAKG